MKIKYENSVDDLVKLNMSIFKRDPVIQKRYKIKYAIVPIVIIIDFLGVSWFTRFTRNKITNIFLVFCLTIMILWIIFYPKLAKFQYKKMLTRRLQNNINDKFESILTIDKNGIIDETKTVISKFSWDNIDEVKDIGTHIFIYISNLNAIVIPNNAFKNDEERKELLKVINENIKK